jgi:hypothetical protein
MRDIFVKSQWDTAWGFLHQGHPPLWMVLAVINGGFLLFWLYMKMVKDRPMRPASIHTMRVLFVVLNFAAVYRDETIRLVRPFLSNLNIM